MARIVRWDPFNELRQMMVNWPTEYEFEDGFGMNMAVDVSENDDNVVIEADLPGIKPEEVDITVTADQVTIKAERQEQEEEKGKNYLRRERRFGQTSRTIALPTPVVGEQADATFEDGKLTLTLPKVEEVRPKQVKITPKKRE
jgi:HSP20 family protein